MRARDSHRRAARRIWLACLRDGEVQPDALRFAVGALADHPERGGAAVLAALGDRVRRYRCLHQARVDSAVPLDARTRAAVAKRLAAAPLRATAVEFGVEPALMAGLRLRIGYTLYDASVRGRLERLGRALYDD
jgi:F-type H+-transporting ATPase subunit delta